MQEAIERLKGEYARRRERNPGFSLRAYARWLGMSPAQLSQLLSGKRRLTQRTAALAADRLGFSPREKIRFISSTSEHVTRVEKESARAKRYLDLDEDRFRLIADWHHFAILSLTRVKGAKADPRWVGRRLGISAAEANQALARLVRLGVLSSPPAFRQISDPIRVFPTQASAAVRAYHTQCLQLAISKLEEVPPERRHFHSITFGGDSKKLELARKRIEECVQEINEVMEAEEGKASGVYTLALQLFPVTCESSNQEKR